jgi:methyl-accepting chemotaxis protein
MKQMMLKQLEKEAITLEGTKNKFLNFKNSQIKSLDFNTNDSNNLLNDDLEHGDYKVCSTQIKNLNDIAEYRNKKFKSIYEQSKIVETMTKDLNIITKTHTQKLETIDDNIDNLKHNAQQTFRTVLKTSEEDKKFKENKCCVMLLIAFALFFMLLIFLNYNSTK